jgi:hypothetical protein
LFYIFSGNSVAEINPTIFFMKNRDSWKKKILLIGSRYNRGEFNREFWEEGVLPNSL